jgi:hypothetical protein
MTSLDRLPDPVDVAVLVQQVVWTFLGEQALPVDRRSTLAHGECWTGCVRVEGPFCGAVTVTASARLARRLGKIMFEEEEPSVEDARDAFAEFTNVIGGNLKALLSMLVGETCRLCLPVVAQGAIPIAGVKQHQEADFEFGDEHLAIDIFELLPPAAMVDQERV